MPIQACTINGKRGWRWGRHGKCYAGPSGRAKAERQMRAIEARSFATTGKPAK